MEKIKITTAKVNLQKDIHTCPNCANQFKGKICNECGEKVFHPSHLSVKHFAEQAVDFFTHFENKVLRSIRLNFLKPGFIAKENLRGVTVPYARPIQLFLIVNVIFFFTMHFLGVTDYTPGIGDHHYFSISGYKLFSWARPLDSVTQTATDRLIDKRLTEHIAIQKKEFFADTAFHYKNIPAAGDILAYTSTNDFLKDYTEKVSVYSKLLIFTTIPVIAGLFILFFRRKLQRYGASLVLATHFLTYNLLIFSLQSIISYLPAMIWGRQYVALDMYPFRQLFYNAVTAPVSNFLFGSLFAFMHFMFWMPWLFIAFKRLFQVHWLKNLLISYTLVHIIFYLIFGIYKKLLVVFTVWQMSH